jgi:hypothetical protein
MIPNSARPERIHHPLVMWPSKKVLKAAGFRDPEPKFH